MVYSSDDTDDSDNEQHKKDDTPTHLPKKTKQNPTLPTGPSKTQSVSLSEIPSNENNNEEPDIPQSPSRSINSPSLPNNDDEVASNDNLNDDLHELGYLGNENNDDGGGRHVDLPRDDVDEDETNENQGNPNDLNNRNNNNQQNRNERADQRNRNHRQNQRDPTKLYTKTPMFILQCIDYYERPQNEHARREKQNRYKSLDDQPDVIYLGENITIRRQAWDLILIEKPSIFVSSLAIHIWGGHDVLANRALDLTHGVENIPDRSPIYLGENITIRRQAWDLILIEKPSIFVSSLAIHIWGGHDVLANRSLDLTHGVENIPDRSPVKLIEKNLLRLHISLFYDFLKSNTSLRTKERSTQLSKVIYYLRHKIRNLRREEKDRHLTQEQKQLQIAKRRLRYNYSG
ncbi:hypothetical protein TSAR_016638 [Trichomalopsis sarcophagae]|uniref:Uncharacterized protein n=1 Tax=Trichomalopsis sarcophagae TaxID=543379 RepID=A0A232EFR2_9HYME|nr:hypothetical protein TSAR_016638 [Trichomalopsis sarcophagae]